MSGFLYQSSLRLFLALPAILLAIRFFRPRLLPWWAMTLLVSFLGWGVINVTVYFRNYSGRHAANDLFGHEWGTGNCQFDSIKDLTAILSQCGYVGTDPCEILCSG